MLLSQIIRLIFPLSKGEILCISWSSLIHTTAIMGKTAYLTAVEIQDGYHRHPTKGG